MSEQEPKVTIEIRSHKTYLQREVYIFETAVVDLGGLDGLPRSVQSQNIVQAAIMAGWVEDGRLQVTDDGTTYWIGAREVGDHAPAEIRKLSDLLAVEYNLAVSYDEKN